MNTEFVSAVLFIFSRARLVAVISLLVFLTVCVLGYSVLKLFLSLTETSRKLWDGTRTKKQNNYSPDYDNFSCTYHFSAPLI